MSYCRLLCCSTIFWVSSDIYFPKNNVALGVEVERQIGATSFAIWISMLKKGVNVSCACSLNIPHFFGFVQISIARTCNCIYALLQQRQRDIEFRESTNDLRQR